MTITISEESPLQDDVRILISEMNAVLHTLTPPEHCYQMTADEMAQPDTTVFVARETARNPVRPAVRGKHWTTPLV